MANEITRLEKFVKACKRTLHYNDDNILFLVSTGLLVTYGFITILFLFPKFVLAIFFVGLPLLALIYTARCFIKEYKELE